MNMLMNNSRNRETIWMVVMHRHYLIISTLLVVCFLDRSILTSSAFVFRFPTTSTLIQKQKQNKQKSLQRHLTDPTNNGNNDDDNKKENWTYNPFDVNDLSPADTLMRRGIVPMGIRIFQSKKYEDAVEKYMMKERCDRATAQRNMDAFFIDPIGWVISYQRKRDLNEDFGDINAPTGVQKRPIFSFFWGSFCVWLFFVFFPTRIQELGGIQPTALSENGVCLYQTRDPTDGALYCKDGPKMTFEKNAMRYLDDQQQKEQQDGMMKMTK